MTVRWPTPEELLELALDQADAAAHVYLLERAFLGGILVGDGIERTWALLGPGDFADVLHGRIWGACLRLRSRCSVDYIIDGYREVADIPGAHDRLDHLLGEYVAGEEG